MALKDAHPLGDRYPVGVRDMKAEELGDRLDLVLAVLHGEFDDERVMPTPDEGELVKVGNNDAETPDEGELVKVGNDDAETPIDADGVTVDNSVALENEDIETDAVADPLSLDEIVDIVVAVRPEDSVLVPDGAVDDVDRAVADLDGGKVAVGEGDDVVETDAVAAALTETVTEGDFVYLADAVREADEDGELDLFGLAVELADDTCVMDLMALSVLTKLTEDDAEMETVFDAAAEALDDLECKLDAVGESESVASTEPVGERVIDAERVETADELTLSVPVAHDECDAVSQFELVVDTVFVITPV